MRYLRAAYSCEILKLYRSKILWLTILAFLIVPVVGGFFMFVLKDPDFARSSGLIGAKAQLTIGTADWRSYFQFLAQAVSVGGLFIFGFASSWIFGREFSDRTVKDLLALPIPRKVIVEAKFIILLLWCAGLSITVFLLGLWVGNIVVLPGWSEQLLFQGLATFAICSFLTIALSTPVAFFASIGKGYLTPLGFIVFSLVAAQIVAATGYGEFFPWAIPALFSEIAGSRSAHPSNLSYLLVFMTSIAGLMGTIYWWQYADHY